jgi:hypothetical protein
MEIYPSGLRMNPSPEAGLLLDQIFDWVHHAAARQRVQFDNAVKLYRF